MTDIGSGFYNLDGQANLLSSNMVNKQDKDKALEEAKNSAKTDGNNNVVISSEIGENSIISNIKLADTFPLEKLALGNKIQFGSITGTIQLVDNKIDDGVQPVKQVSNENTMDNFNGLKLTENQALKFILGHQGSSDDLEDLRGNNYSSREMKELISSYQEEVGVEKTGVWDEATYSKAKASFVQEYDEYISDNQFDNVIKDMIHYFDGKLNYDQVEENLEGYFYDQLQNPVNEPFEIDKAGHAEYTSKFSMEDILKVNLYDFGLDKEEMDILTFIVENRNEPELAQKIQNKFPDLDIEDANDYINEMKEDYGNGKIPSMTELSKVVISELQKEFFDDNSKITGNFDAETFSRSLHMFKEENGEDHSLSQMKEIFTKYSSEVLNYTNGKITEDQLDDKIDAMLE